MSDPNFPCSLIIDLPLPTARLATAAKRALQVDAELSPLVHRQFTCVVPEIPIDSTAPIHNEASILRAEYQATTNRMLRVAVNGFMESLTVVLGTMEELDVDVLEIGVP